MCFVKGVIRKIQVSKKDLSCLLHWKGYLSLQGLSKTQAFSGTAGEEKKERANCSNWLRIMTDYVNFTLPIIFQQLVQTLSNSPLHTEDQLAPLH